MVEKRVEMELYPFDDLWGDLSFGIKRPLGWFVVICRASDLWGGLSFVDKETSDKETSEAVCPQVGTNSPRGHINVMLRSY